MHKTRKRYNKGKRVDMRNGGRVRLHKGDQPPLLNHEHDESRKCNPI